MSRSRCIFGTLISSVVLGLAIGPSSADAQVRVDGLNIRGNGGVRGAIVLNQLPFPNEPERSSADNNLFVTNRQMTRALRQAEDLFKKKQYDDGILLIQKLILDSPEDFLFYPDKKIRTSFRSLKTEALKTLDGLPAEGLAAYEREYGPTARHLFLEAVINRDLVAVEEVARRFFHTKAGAEATYWLGSHHMDHGNLLAAVMHFDRLRKHSRSAQKWEPMLTLKVAICWEQSGFPQKSTETLLGLKSVTPNDRIVLGGRAIPLFRDNRDARDWLLRILKQPRRFSSPEQTQWTLFRGNLQRNASSPPASPVWDSQWVSRTIRSAQEVRAGQSELIEAQLTALEENSRRNNRLTLPAVHPLIIGETVVFRTLRNLRAVHLKTGELLWESVQSDPTYETLFEQPRSDTFSGSFRSPQQQFLMQRAWNDLTAGTFSSDGKFLYALEELGYVRHVLQPTRVVGNTSLLRKYNKLMAIELSSGKLKWEIGGSEMENALPLAGAFFLGPPIPLGRQLFILAELNGEIKLLELQVEQTQSDSQGGERYNVKLAWSQTLLQPQGSVQHSPRRRLAGLSPSFDSGVLVCPTAAGAVVAVDLSRKLLLWGYAYRPKNVNSFENRHLQMRFGFRSGNYLMPFNMNEDRWVDSAVTIADGKVLLTPSDSNELHCLNLLDGTLLWKKPRGQGLYLAGVYAGKAVVVGRTQIEAWDLADGSRAWKEPTPIAMPSGRGFRSDRFYHLPLSTAEIATIDLASGRILARSKSRNGHLPGNLVSSRGVIVSQTANSIVGYKSLFVLNETVQNVLQKNPNDPDALALRGEMKLHQGDENGGLADLARSVSLKPDSRSQGVMTATLLEGLRRDFEKYKNSTEQIRKLIIDPQQQSIFLRLYAEGLEEIGQHREAFSEYLHLVGSGPDSPHLEDASNLLSVRSHLLIQPRLEKIYKAASANDRAAMDSELAAQLAKATGENGPAALRTFLNSFSPFPIADDAQRMLVDRLDERQHALELEILLLRLRNSGDSSTAGFATARLAKFFIGLNRHADAVRFVKELDERYKDVICLDDKTGGQLAEQWRRDKNISKWLVADDTWPNRRIEAIYQPVKKPTIRRNPVPMIGAAVPFFENWSFELEQGIRVFFNANDRYGREKWKVPTNPANNQRVAFYGNYVRAHGHLVAAVFGNYFVVFDTLTPNEVPKILWMANLYDSESAGPSGSRLQRRPIPLPNGKFRMGIADAYGRPFGKVGPITDGLLFYQAGSTLFAADLLTGETIWKRKNIPYGSDIVLNRNVLTLFSQNSVQAVLLRVNNGEKIGRRSLPPANERLLVTGRYVVSWKQQGNKRVLWVADLLTEKTLWRQEFTQRSVVSLVRNEEIAVVEPEGRLHILAVADGAEKLNTFIEPQNRISQILVRRTSDLYVLLTHAQDPKPFTFNIQGIRPDNFPVNGNAFGFDRKTGKRIWATKIEHHAFESAQPNNLPILVFCSYSFPTNRRDPFSRQMRFRVSILDTRNGDMIYDHSTKKLAAAFRLKVNPEEQTITVTFQRSFVSLATTDKPLKTPATLKNTTEDSDSKSN